MGKKIIGILAAIAIIVIIILVALTKPEPDPDDRIIDQQQAAADTLLPVQADSVLTDPAALH